MAALVGDEGADDGELVHLPGDGWQHLADLDAGGLGLDRLELAAGRGIGLEVPQVHVTGPAAHPEDDKALVSLLELVLDGAEALEELHTRDSEGGEARHVLKEMPPIHSAAHVPSPCMSIVERIDSVFSFAGKGCAVQDFVPRLAR